MVGLERDFVARRPRSLSGGQCQRAGIARAGGHGAHAEQEFKREDALPLVARMKTGHFAPGTQYSYCNCNFRILSELIEGETGEALEALYRKHIWGPARMETAVLTSDTSRPEDGVIGYEGQTSLRAVLRSVKDANKRQQDRFKNGLVNLIYTNCLDLDFYRNGQRVASVTIGDFLMGI